MIAAIADFALGKGYNRTAWPLIFVSTILQIFLRKLVTSIMIKHVEKVPDVKKTQPPKAADSFYYACFYTFTWFSSIATIFSIGLNPFYMMFHPKVLDWHEPEPKQLLYYSYLQIGHYLSCTYYILSKRDVRKSYSDAIMMIVHHFVTISLIYTSVRWPIFELGLCISLFLFDVSDIFMELAKYFGYVKKTVLCHTFYAMLVPSWGILRCVFFPLTSIRATFLYYNGTSAPNRFLGVFESIISVLSAIWWKMILSMVAKALKGTLNKDVRSEDEDEGAEETASKKDEVEDKNAKTEETVSKKKKVKGTNAITKQPASKKDEVEDKNDKTEEPVQKKKKVKGTNALTEETVSKKE